MFSEISQVVAAGLLASGLIATTVITTNTNLSEARGRAPAGGLVYNKPLFSCSQGSTLYDRITKNENIPQTKKQELITILMKDMPQNCQELCRTAKPYCEQ